MLHQSIQRTFLLVIPTLIGAILIVTSCKKDQVESTKRKLELPEQTYRYDNPEKHGTMATTIDRQMMRFEVNNEVATLGRVLFYDQGVSLNASTSCASCHDQSLAFADSKQFSTGFTNQPTSRNSLSLQNPALRTSGYFWDGRAKTLEEQVTMPITDHVEMGMRDTAELVQRIAALPYYSELFEKAYGDKSISTKGIRTALATFLRSMWTASSKYDRGEDMEFSNFTAQELRGKDLFFMELSCGGCHNAPSFEGWGPANIGLDLVYEDEGFGKQTTQFEGQVFENDMTGWFTVPTLRNIELTGPYMHDGRFNTLREVIDFYNENIQAHPGLDYRLRDFGNGNGLIDPIFGDPGNGNGEVRPVRMNLSDADKDALIAFLKTLTDPNFLSDPKFADPFVYE